MRLIFVLVMILSHGSALAKADSIHAVMRLGRQSGQALILPCRTDQELSAEAANEHRTYEFGWQFKSSMFSCRALTPALSSPGAAISADCLYEGTDAPFVDLFFVSGEQCRAFEAAIRPVCHERPASECLELLEHVMGNAGKLPVTGPI
jgi:hypothetical protein